MSDIKRVISLCNLLIEQESAVEKAETELKRLKAEALRTKREDLPTLMQEFGLDSMKLENGFEISIKEDVEARIAEQYREAAHAWLSNNGFGGLIKTEVVVEFGRGEHEEALICANVLREGHEHVNLEEVVHPQTLKAFIREQLSEGRSVPTDLFGISPFSYAKITAKKR